MNLSNTIEVLPCPALPCPICGDDLQTVPSWNDGESIIWWDCGCSLSGPDARTQQEAILGWNKMVINMLNDPKE